MSNEKPDTLLTRLPDNVCSDAVIQANISVETDVEYTVVVEGEDDRDLCALIDSKGFSHTKKKQSAAATARAIRNRQMPKRAL